MATERIYILGCGAIGIALAVHLTNAGRQVTAVRTSLDDLNRQTVNITIHMGQGRTLICPVETISLARLKRLSGTIVITAKSYANPLIAARLIAMETSEPIVVVQNGIGVESPYLALGGSSIYRCVLYATSQKNRDNSYSFAPVATSLIGPIRGSQAGLEAIVNLLNTAEFPFTAHPSIQSEVWKKAVLNAVFNSICPLLEVDNGIFVRDEQAARLAREVVNECLAVMQSLGFDVQADEVMAQLFTVSRRSSGQLISTLQDINQGRETEIDSLNLEIARVAESLPHPVQTRVTKALGEMVRMKSQLRMKPARLPQP